MKINGKNPGVGTDNYIGKSSGAGSAKKSGQADGSRGDTVSISTAGRELSVVKNLLASVPDVRGDMVVRLRTEIANGDYEVDAGKVAEKMIERAILNSISSME